MKLFIYNVKSNEVIAVINGTTNKECEHIANMHNFMGCDEFGGTYVDMSEYETPETEYIDAL
jgi:curli biogenesis system outer membrane secretion channel CsgG